MADQVKKLNGIAIKENIGHSFIKKRMVKENAIFGGELTRHCYFRDFYFLDTVILPSLILWEVLSISGSSLSSISENLKKEYFLSGEINIPVTEKSQAQIKFQDLESLFEKKVEIEKIDSVSVISTDWRLNLRLSNTEPLIRLNLEAKSKSISEKNLNFYSNLFLNEQRLDYLFL